MVSVIFVEQCKVYRDIEVCACLKKMIVIMINARIRLAYDDDDLAVVMVLCRQW